jgi:hypothetical protein
VLVPLRHVESFAELARDEATTFGELVRVACVALRDRRLHEQRDWEEERDRLALDLRARIEPTLT